jgi:GNAT superfamily N-acetyltransferase
MTGSAVLSPPAGVQSHGRSLIVWPQSLEADGIELLRFAVPLGARIIVIGGTLAECPIWPGEVQGRRLLVYHSSSPLGEGAPAPLPLDQETALRVQALHRACGLTPLPLASLVSGAEWVHSFVCAAQDVVAVASLERLNYPLPGRQAAVSLLCAIAVHPSFRRRGLGARAVEGVLTRSSTGAAIALLEANGSSSRPFFEHLGWYETGIVAETTQWN